VLGNDTDADANPLTATKVTDPAHGTVTLAANGSFTYTPAAGYSGPDSFAYQANDGAANSNVATVNITVTAPAATGPTTLSIGDISFNEGDSGPTAATFTVTRSGSTAGASTAKYKTSGGTATAGTDYTAVTTLGTVNFAVGQTSATVSVDVAGDTTPEANETFNLLLSAPSGATIADTTGLATILNDDAPAYLRVADVVVNEGNAGTTAATFTVSRSGNTANPATVSVKTGGGTATAGTDYTAVTATPLSFPAGETSASVTANVTGDTVDEANETITLTLSAAVGATISDTTGTATNVDDDGPIKAGPSTFLTVGDLSVREGNSDTTAANFIVSRSGLTTGESTVKYTISATTATAGTDYTSIPSGTLTFAAGQSSATVTVDVATDTVAEPDETFKLVLSTPTGAVTSDTTGVATIVNDDGPAYLSVGNVSVSEGNSGTTAATFTITRSGNTTGASTVKYKTSGGTATAGTDYTTVALTEVAFAPGETSATVTVDVTGDNVKEGNETFNLMLSMQTGATISDASGTATIVNDD
jgi:VCBS repeat-containing protein